MSLTCQQPIKRGRGRPMKARVMNGRGMSGRILSSATMRGRGMRGRGMRGRGRGMRVSTQSRTTPLVMMERLDVSGMVDRRIGIGVEKERWNLLKGDHATDQEFAKSLLDFWEKEKENTLNIGPATLKDFQNFQERTNRSSDELIRFFLRLDVEPGQCLVTVSDKNMKQLETLKHLMKLCTDDVLTYLLYLHECSASSDSPDSMKMMQSMAAIKESVRQAVRTEISQLYSGGVLPRAQQDKRPRSREYDKLQTPAVSVEVRPENKRSRMTSPNRHQSVATQEVADELEQTSHLAVSGQTDSNDENVAIEYTYVMEPNPSATHSLLNIKVERETTLPSVVVHTPSRREREDLSVSARQQQQEAAKPFSCPKCDYRSELKKNLRRHMNEHIENPFKCSLCTQGFQDKQSLKEHFKVKHKKREHFECARCGKNFISRPGLKQHMKTLHQTDYSFWCLECSRGFNHESVLHDHNEKFHGHKQCKCSSCCNIFNKFTFHQKKSSKKTIAPDQRMCETCCQTFTTVHGYRDHVCVKHGEMVSYKCDCGQEFRKDSDLKRHKKICVVCASRKQGSAGLMVRETDGLQNVEIINVESLFEDSAVKSENDNDDPGDSIQIMNIESGEQYICDLTSETVTNSTGEENICDLTSEPVTNNTNEEYVCDLTDTVKNKRGKEVDGHKCPICPFTATRLSVMNRHTMTHYKPEIKKYDCPKCPKSYADQNKLQDHLASKHNYKPRYRCDKCTRTFCSKGGIMYHQQTKHNNIYKYKCETCDKGFNTYQHYLGHKNTHNGIRPHVCDKCGLGFAYPSVLSSHKRVCKGKVPGMNLNGHLDLFPCKDCTKKFGSFEVLQAHVESYHPHHIIKENSFLCECGEEFQLKALFDYHALTCNKNRGVDILIENLDAEQEDAVLEQAQTDSVTEQTQTSYIDDCEEAVAAADMEFTQISLEKFNSIAKSLPVFPQ